MSSLTRRKFLAGCAGITTGASSAAATLNWADLMLAADSDPLPPESGILVLVTMYGGNDGINTVVPLNNDAYHDARPELAYAPDELLPLDGDFGLNPAMPGFASMFESNSLAIVRGVGYPEPDRSHFRSMDIWQKRIHRQPCNNRLGRPLARRRRRRPSTRTQYRICPAEAGKRRNHDGSRVRFAGGAT
jgi:uncharacterized protein (DUF1501 family)